MMKRLVLSVILLIFVSCSANRSISHSKLTPEQRAEVKANGGFNPYYVSPKSNKVWMPKRPRR